MSLTYVTNPPTLASHPACPEYVESNVIHSLKRRWSPTSRNRVRRQQEPAKDHDYQLSDEVVSIGSSTESDESIRSVAHVRTTRTSTSCLVVSTTTSRGLVAPTPAPPVTVTISAPSLIKVTVTAITTVTAAPEPPATNVTGSLRLSSSTASASTPSLTPAPQIVNQPALEFSTVPSNSSTATQLWDLSPSDRPQRESNGTGRPYYERPPPPALPLRDDGLSSSTKAGIAMGTICKFTRRGQEMTADAPRPQLVINTGLMQSASPSCAASPSSPTDGASSNFGRSNIRRHYIRRRGSDRYPSPCHREPTRSSSTRCWRQPTRRMPAYSTLQGLSP
jgi:hypothetical protein